MIKKFTFAILLTFMLAALSPAQTTNTPSPATRQRTVNANPKLQPNTQDDAPKGIPAKKPVSISDKKAKTKDPASPNVLDVFEALLDGIRAADVKLVTGIYWNSPQLILFNGNGTVTKGWEQMRKNRESSYPEMKDVVLDVRNMSATMLGRDGAVVNFLWTQSQTYKGTPETASGRTSLIFRRTGNTWKIVHAHVSPDAPDPSRVLPSEQTSTPTEKPSPTRPR